MLTTQQTVDNASALGLPSAVVLRSLSFLLCLWVLTPSFAAAQEPADAESSIEELRSSHPYREGLDEVFSKFQLAYDSGAKQWSANHEYFMEVARTRGCESGAPYGDGSTKACGKVSKAQPTFLGSH